MQPIVVVEPKGSSALIAILKRRIEALAGWLSNTYPRSAYFSQGSSKYVKLTRSALVSTHLGD